MPGDGDLAAEYFFEIEAAITQGLISDSLHAPVRDRNMGLPAFIDEDRTLRQLGAIRRCRGQLNLAHFCFSYLRAGFWSALGDAFPGDLPAVRFRSNGGLAADGPETASPQPLLALAAHLGPIDASGGLDLPVSGSNAERAVALDHTSAVVVDQLELGQSRRRRDHHLIVVRQVGVHPHAGHEIAERLPPALDPAPKLETDVVGFGRGLPADGDLTAGGAVARECVQGHREGPGDPHIVLDLAVGGDTDEVRLIEAAARGGGGGGKEPEAGVQGVVQPIEPGSHGDRKRVRALGHGPREELARVGEIAVFIPVEPGSEEGAGGCVAHIDADRLGRAGRPIVVDDNGDAVFLGAVAGGVGGGLAIGLEDDVAEIWAGDVDVVVRPAGRLGCRKHPAGLP